MSNATKGTQDEVRCELHSRLTAKGGCAEPVAHQQPDDAGKGKAKKVSKSKAKKRDDSDEVRESGT